MAASAGFFLSPQQTDILSAAASARAQIAVLVEGTFDESRLQAALLEVVKQNEALRTIFQRQTGMKMPFQVVLDESQPVWTRTEVPQMAGGVHASATGWMEQEAQQSMPAESLQLRSTLFAEDGGRSLWVLTAHSAVADAKSMQLLLAETLKAYAGEPASDEEALRYVQFGQWQNDLLAGDDEAAEEGRKFWAAQTVEPHSFPGQNPNASDLESIRRIDVPVPGDPAALAASAGADVSASDVLLTAWAAVLARWSGQPRIRVGKVADGREFEELANLIGAVSKTLPVVVTLKDHHTFAQLVADVHAQAAEAAAAQEYLAPERTFLAAYEWLDLGSPIECAGAKFSPLCLRNSAHDAALQLNVYSTPERLQLELQYNPASIASEAAEEIAVAFGSLLSAALSAPDQSVNRLPMISSTRRQQMLFQWAGATTPVPSASIHALISAQAGRTPAAMAVRSGGESLTYAELEARSNRLARYLVSAGVTPGGLVGLCVARSAQMMVPVLAILKAGAAYVPLSADQPKPRTQQQLTGIHVLLTESAFAGQLPEFPGRTLVLDGHDRPWEQQPATDPAVEVSGDALAYVIYTSGSTGTPKGVGVRHRNLVNYASHIVNALALQPGLQYATVSTLAADLGNTVIYPALITGGCLHVLPYEVATDAKAMAAYQAQHGIDVLKIVPSHLAALLDAGAGDGLGVLPKKYLITGGEALKPALVARLAAAPCALINHYGPTETTIGSLMLPLKDFDWQHTTLATIPIGRPIANTRVYVLDPNRELVPIGVAGELYIAGAGVTAGYVGQPEKTAERFLADPFHPDETMYRTGDLVRWLPEGLIEFLGRTDDQVKIRGYRVELGEIESILAAQPGVRQCVVLARTKPSSDADAADDRQVVAYVVLDRQQATTTDTLRQALKDRLPDYMVPAAFVELQKLPLTANGKIDRKNLPEPAPFGSTVHGGREASTRMEMALAEIWKEVLQVPSVTVEDDFFQLGGHSLMAATMIARLNETLGYTVRLATLFEAPTLGALAAAAEQQGLEQEELTAITAIRKKGTKPALFCVSRPNVNALGFLFLSRGLSPELPVFGLQSIMENDGVRMPFSPKEYEEKAAEYVAAMRQVQPEGPYFLTGYCEGAHIAFEMARQLEVAGLEVGGLFILDVWPVENTISRPRFIIRNYGRVVLHFLRSNNHDRLGMFLRKLDHRAAVEPKMTRIGPKTLGVGDWDHKERKHISYTAASRYWPGKDFKPTIYNGDIVVFRMVKQAFHRIQDESLGWRARVTGEVTIIRVPGHHSHILRAPGVEKIAVDLEAHIDRYLATRDRAVSADRAVPANR